MMRLCFIRLCHIGPMAKKEVVTYSQQTFEKIKHIDENGAEFWYARELQTALEYAQWRRFQESIERAKTA